MMSLLLFLGTLLALFGAMHGVLWILRYLADRKRERELVFLQILMPKKDSKEDKETEGEQFSTGKSFKDVLGIMDHLFQTLSSLKISGIKRYWKSSHFFSCEYAAFGSEILTFVVAPRNIIPLIEKQITSFYPDAVIDIVEDYNIFTRNSVVETKYLFPNKSFVLPFRTYDHLKSDAYNAITNAFSKLSKDEGAAVQFVIRPIKSGWQKSLQKEAQKIINPKKSSHKFSWWNPLSWISSIVDLFSGDGKETPEMGGSERVSQMVEELSKAIDEKANSPGFEVVIRLVSSSENHDRAKLNLESIVSSFTQFNDVR